MAPNDNNRMVVPDGAFSNVHMALAQSVLTQGLSIQDQNLKSLPHGRHWHVRKPGVKGTLEITYDGQELWMEVRANRQGEWIDAAVDQLMRALKSSCPDGQEAC